MHFPSWRYHRTLEPRIVRDAAEDAALGEGWADTPAAFAEPEPVEDPTDLPDDLPGGVPMVIEGEFQPVKPKRKGKK